MDDFMTRCRNQATKCKFRDATETEERLIEQLIIGTKQKKVQERLLEKGEKLKLDIATDIARTYEATISHMERLTGVKQHDVHTVRSYNQRNPQKCLNCGREHPDVQTKKQMPCLWYRMWQLWSRAPRSRAPPRSRSRQRTPHRQFRERSPSAHHRSQHIHWMSNDQASRDLSDHFETITFESITVDSLLSQNQQTTRDEVCQHRCSVQRATPHSVKSQA